MTNPPLLLSPKYMLCDIPDGLHGAAQIYVGPSSPRFSPEAGWKEGFWLIEIDDRGQDKNDPLGWPIRRGICTIKELPQWARERLEEV